MEKDTSVIHSSKIIPSNDFPASGKIVKRPNYALLTPCLRPAYALLTPRLRPAYALLTPCLRPSYAPLTLVLYPSTPCLNSAYNLCTVRLCSAYALPTLQLMLHLRSSDNTTNLRLRSTDTLPTLCLHSTPTSWLWWHRVSQTLSLTQDRGSRHHTARRPSNMGIHQYPESNVHWSGRGSLSVNPLLSSGSSSPWFHSIFPPQDLSRQVYCCVRVAIGGV